MLNKTQRVIINTSGGCIQDILADAPNDLEIIVVDWDDIAPDPIYDHIHTVKDEDGRRRMHYSPRLVT
jgi:hypothetical protein